MMGVDVGTSSLKTIIIDDKGLVKALGSQDYQYDTPQPGYAEQDPEVWWRACQSSIRQAMDKSGLTGSDIAAVGFSGQMHGLVMLDREGKSLRPAILHCDSRSAGQVRWLNDQFEEKGLFETAMNRVYTGFLTPSLMWIKENEPETYERIYKVCLPKDYIRFKLAGTIGSDYSDASATLGFDIKNNCWSESILGVAGLDIALFPQCDEAGAKIGMVCPEGAEATGLSTSTLVAAGGADAVMQGIGNGASNINTVTANIGSSGQVCFQSNKPIQDPSLSTNNFCGYKKGRWISMGAIMHAGLVLKWFGSLVGVRDYKQLDEEAQRSTPGSGGLVFLPYLNGERTPHMNPNLSGLLLGCTTETSKADMARSMMEGVAFALNQCMEICNGLGLYADSVVASGGGARSPLWLQIQADIYGLPVRVAKISEQAALGAAIAAGAAAGVYANIEEGCAAVVRYKDEIILPNSKTAQLYKDYYQLYKDAYTANKQLLERVTLLGRSSRHNF